MNRYEDLKMKNYKEAKAENEKQRSVTWFLFWVLVLSVSVNGMFCWVVFIK